MKRDRIRRAILITVCMIIAACVIMLFFTQPGAGLPNDNAREYILKNHLEHTGADNSVSAIYLNYRLWDTLFEALVLLVSAVAVISFSRSDDHER